MGLRNWWVEKVNSFSIEASSSLGGRAKELWDFVIVPDYFEEKSDKPECSRKRKGQETMEVGKSQEHLSLIHI